MLDLIQTIRLLKEANLFVKNAAKQGKTFLFIGTKNQASKTICEQAIKSNSLVSSGGRVLNIVVKGRTFLQIRNKILKILKKINWKHGFFRKDIGWRVIKSR